MVAMRWKKTGGGVQKPLGACIFGCHFFLMDFALAMRQLWQYFWCLHVLPHLNFIVPPLHHSCCSNNSKQCNLPPPFCTKKPPALY